MISRHEGGNKLSVHLENYKCLELFEELPASHKHSAVWF